MGFKTFFYVVRHLDSIASYLPTGLHLGFFHFSEPLSRFFLACVCFVGWWGAGPSTQLPAWRTSVSLFVWVLCFDLSGKGGPTSSYATAGIALRIIAPHKPPYPAKDAFVKVEIPQGGPCSVQLKKKKSLFSGTVPVVLIQFLSHVLSYPPCFICWSDWSL